jgi:uncharacterized protein YfaP (DUF2135 family)
MLNRVTLASILLLALAPPALADPPADLDACLDLWTQIAKSAGEKIKSEAEYAKYYLKQLNLASACGTRDFAGAEKIADEMRATFHLD